MKNKEAAIAAIRTCRTGDSLNDMLIFLTGTWRLNEYYDRMRVPSRAV
jgi:hypothetical protein